jgi:hypothetical protein
MAIRLKQSTASQEVPLGPFLDDTDGKTQETALTISNTDIKIWKTGATTLADKNSGGATHIAQGVYYCVLDATDTDTLGPLVIFIHEAGALPIKVECEVVTVNAYDDAISGGIKAVTDKLNSMVVAGAGSPTDFRFLAEAFDLAAIAIADALLDRDMSAGTDSGTATIRTVRQALRFLRNKWSLSGTTLTVTKENDSTTSWTAVVTNDAAAEPIIGNDPAS